MILTGVILFLASLLGGGLLFFYPNIKKNIRIPLIFAGSYLFSITIIHLLPELFFVAKDASKVAIFILLGFFIQQVLEYFSSGIEHGHFHTEKVVSFNGKLSILIALVLHSLLEGSIMNHESPLHDHDHGSHSLLLGIVLHKAPAAFALMAIMQGSGKQAILFLIIFSISSPLGLFLSDVFTTSKEFLITLFAIVCGSFLHISTTIFVETSPNHKMNWKNIVTSMIGALFAVVIEYFI